MKKVMIFGTFDGIHEGHRAMFKEAKKYGDFLIAVATPDELVFRLKEYAPIHSLSERLSLLKNESFIDEAIPGDKELSSWRVLVTHRPEVIALGYDQRNLHTDLEKQVTHLEFKPRIVTLTSFKPHNYHNAIFRKFAGGNK